MSVHVAVVYIFSPMFQCVENVSRQNCPVCMEVMKIESTTGLLISLFFLQSIKFSIVCCLNRIFTRPELVLTFFHAAIFYTSRSRSLILIGIDVRFNSLFLAVCFITIFDYTLWHLTDGFLYRLITLIYYFLK